MNKAIFNTIESYLDKLVEINQLLGYPDDRGTVTYASFEPEPVEIYEQDEEGNDILVRTYYEMQIEQSVLHLFHNHTEFTEGYAKLIAKKAQDKPVRVLVPIDVFKDWQESSHPEVIALMQYCNANGITEAAFEEGFTEGYDVENILPKQVYLEFIYPIHAELAVKHGAIIEE